jgi:hypothetical protein
MRKRNLWQALILVLCGASFTYGQRTQIVYDPMVHSESAPPTVEEDRLMRRSVLPKARAEWKENESCGEDFRLIDSALGSFTRRGARQKAFLYEFCQTGNGFANNGLIITEGGKILLHFAEEGGWNMAMRSLPDINRNGLDELVVETSSGMHQGKVGGSVTLLEVSPAAVRELGYTLAFSNECDAEMSEDECDRSYRITAAPGARPVFYRQRFVNVGDEEKPRWRKRGKLQKIRLNKTEVKFKLLR